MGQFGFFDQDTLKIQTDPLSLQNYYRGASLKNLRASSVRPLLLVAATAFLVALPVATLSGAPPHRPAARQTEAQATLQGPLTYVAGTICKSNEGEYILRDASGIGLFWLDDQQLAAKFAGKAVSVTGVLDAANNLIRILNIQSAD